MQPVNSLSFGGNNLDQFKKCKQDESHTQIGASSVIVL